MNFKIKNIKKNIIENNLFVNGKKMIGLGNYHSESVISESLEQLEYLIREKNDILQFSFKTDLLIALRELSKGINMDVIKENEFYKIEELLLTKKESINDFISKWDDSDAILDLTDALDNNEPISFYDSRELLEVEVYSKKHNKTFNLQYSKEVNADMDNFTQLYITEEEYSNLIEDLTCFLVD